MKKKETLIKKDWFYYHPFKSAKETEAQEEKDEKEILVMDESMDLFMANFVESLTDVQISELATHLVYYNELSKKWKDIYMGLLIDKLKDLI